MRYYSRLNDVRHQLGLPEKSMDAACVHCRFSGMGQLGLQRECRRNPPTKECDAGARERNPAYFPSVLDDQWCGEFRPTPEVATELDSDFNVKLSQTKWHPDDLAGRLLSKAGDNPEAVTLPGPAAEDSQTATTRVCVCDQTHYNI